MAAQTRLAYFIDSLQVGGSELNAVRTAERLDRTRFDLTVFHMGASGPLLDRYALLGVPLVRVPVTSLKHPSAIAAGFQLQGELRRRQIQILHTHDIYSNMFAVPWGRFAGVPVVLASKRWLDDAPTRVYGGASRINVVVNGIASRMATAVLANSEAVARSLRERDRVRPERVRVIPNFVGPEAFQPWPPTRREEVLADLDIPAGAIVVGVVARLAPVKDHALLLRSISACAADHPDLFVLLIGEGPSRPDLEALAATLGLSNRIRFAGTLPNTPNPHALLDISVLPSRTEGFPNAVVEAMAANRPVIATAVGGTPEAVRDGVTGLLVPPGDEQALAAAIARLASSPGLRDQLGTAGRERAMQKYHVNVVIERLSDWYDELLRVR